MTKDRWPQLTESLDALEHAQKVDDATIIQTWTVIQYLHFLFEEKGQEVPEPTVRLSSDRTIILSIALGPVLSDGSIDQSIEFEINNDGVVYLEFSSTHGHSVKDVFDFFAKALQNYQK